MRIRVWDPTLSPAAVLLHLLGGAAVVGLALSDVFATVLLPGSGRGPVRRPLSRWVRAVFRCTRHLSPGLRRRLLAYAGPTEVTASLLAWLVLLLVGWAAIYLPALGGAVTAAQGPTERSWGTALYFSGYDLTTLGLGDLVATTAAYRMLVVGEAATGFLTFTMAISYFISVYGTLNGRRTFALALHQRSGGTGHGSEVVRALWEEGPVAAAVDLAAMASDLREVVQTHRAYPVLRSFHDPAGWDALPQVLLTSWETVTLLRTSVDLSQADRPELGGSALREIEMAATALTESLVGPVDADPSPDRRAGWCRDHGRTLADLRRAGVPVIEDSCAGYLDARARWDGALQRLAEELLHDWPGGLRGSD
ncbi:potassium channel family protein [Nocardioides marmoribigeumensis]|jgi:hypothetical protein|uniref:Potassium channel domain-containing protein n=1 Tax=Nocardioides marmoribigeumensis TaxID=433649 RepID=A0ABU2BYZ1_9ACTN|nr:potassium channel family protein [Nocardioides marmoribigeumensis]MDR7363630.1 hypothetical protein [Nocardioides marmoribigeumensis]